MATSTQRDNGGLVVTQQRQVIEQKSQIEDNLGISMKKPKFPQYAVVSKRVDSFKEWPDYLPLRPNVLVDAGLVFTGVGDSVRCYHCGGGLRSWEAEDDPWVEHAKWYPHCPHVLLVKGQEFVDLVGRGDVPQQDGAPSMGEAVIPPVSELLGSIAALSCVQMGFQESLVQQAIQIFIERKGNCKFNGRELCEIIFDLQDSGIESAPARSSQPASQSTVTDGGESLPQNSEPVAAAASNQEEEEDPEEIQALFEENERLKSNKACKICLDAEANIIFLPCGHMVSCPQCAPALLKCPICRNSVKGYVKAFFAA